MLGVFHDLPSTNQPTRAIFHPLGSTTRLPDNTSRSTLTLTVTLPEASSHERHSFPLSGAAEVQGLPHARVSIEARVPIGFPERWFIFKNFS